MAAGSLGCGLGLSSWAGGTGSGPGTMVGNIAARVLTARPSPGLDRRRNNAVRSVSFRQSVGHRNLGSFGMAVGSSDSEWAMRLLSCYQSRAGLGLPLRADR